MRFLVALFFVAFGADNTLARACFDDDRLNHLMANAQRGTLIYVWSPRMGYSVENAAMAARAAATFGLDFVVLHDARVASEEIRQALGVNQTAALRTSADTDLATPPFATPLDTSLPICSAQLIQRDALRHFPTAFVIHQHHFATHAIVGAMPLGAWSSSIAQRLNAPLPSAK